MDKKLPKEFLDRLKEIYEKEELKIINSGFECEKRKTSFRVNTLKSSEKEILDILKQNNLEVEKVNFLKN
jgi:16S rRNA C967 or C1407 C5-methylase (RsmB/RsmF family)